MKNLIGIFLSLCVSNAALSASILINGSGSTFAEPIYTRWFKAYTKNPNASFNYQGVGSGAGMKQMLDGTVDFAGTDDPMKKADEEKSKSTVLHIPIAIGAVVVSYNLDLAKPLKLTGEVIAKIFDGRIKTWNDAEIAKLNPGVKIPEIPIVVATRSDSSGTTAVFSEYLAKVSTDWNGKNGKTVKWFAGSIGAKGNAGVAGLIKQTPGTVGYVELIYAVENKLAFAHVQNKKGEMIEASAESVSVAAQGSAKEAIEKQFKVSITDSANKGAYPISAFTWMLMFDKMKKEKGTAIMGFAKWALSDEAQEIAKSINFAKVPKDIRLAALKSIEKVNLE